MPVDQQRCEACGQSVQPQLERQPLEEGGEEWRFRCPHCGAWNIVGILSAQGVAIREQLQALEEMLLARPGDDGLFRQMVELRRAMRAEMSNLRK